jgi:hypothetical protein
VNETVCDILVNSNSISTFRTVFSLPSDNPWVVLSTNPEHLPKLFPTTEGEGQIFTSHFHKLQLDQLQIPTITTLLEKHYTLELKEGKSNQVTNLQNFKSTMPSNIDTNMAIIDYEEDVNNDSNYEDENEGACDKAKHISLNLSAVVELLYEHGSKEFKAFGHSSYSVEDIATSQASIKFCCRKVNDIYKPFDCDSFELHCKCCGKNVFTDDISRSMDEVLKLLPDAMFCHLFKKVLPPNKISDYLFDNDFDHSTIKTCEKIDYVNLLDAFAQRKQSKEYILDVKRVNNAIFQRNFGDANHPFMTLMCFALRKHMSNQERNGVFKDVDMPTTTHVLLPPSKLSLDFIDIPDNLQPGVDPDTTLMSLLEIITKIDWKNDESLKDATYL